MGMGVVVGVAATASDLPDAMDCAVQRVGQLKQVGDPSSLARTTRELELLYVCVRIPS